MRMAYKFCIATLIVVILANIFIFYQSGLDFNYIIPKRFNRLAAIVIGGACISLSSVIFQTMVGNRILTPGVMGYESIYLLWQALLLLIAGLYGIIWLGISGNFFVSIVIMLIYSFAINQWILRNYKDIYILLLIGLVLTIVITTFTQFIQFSISPGEFSVFQKLSYTSFNRVEPKILIFSIIILIIICVFLQKTLPILDVMLLGREQAISLGIDYFKYVKLYLALIAIVVAISTSLIGPTAFMGIFIANITYAIIGTRKHKFTLPFGCIITIAIFIIAQLLVEHFFNYKTTVGILINFTCGLYFLMLTIRYQRLI